MKAMIQANWVPLVILLGIAFINAIAFQGTRGIYETTEGRYTECARETLLSGNLSEPVLNGQPHWTKPPLTYLAIIGSMHLFGPSPWGLRAFLVIAMMLTAAAVWWTGTGLWGPKAGFWAGIVIATSPFIVGVANIIATDMLVTLWTALAIAAFWHARVHQSRGAALLMWLFLGLGCLTKGPPALLVPLIMIACAVLSLKPGATWRPDAGITLTGIGLFLIVGFGWFAWKAWQHPGLCSYWIGHEVIDRNLSDELKRNPGFSYVLTNYLPIMLLGTGPWLFLALAHGRSEPPWKRLTAPPTSTWNTAVIWAFSASIVLAFIVFSLSHSKLPMYLAPLFVPLCLLIGRTLDLLIQQGHLRHRTATLTTAVLVLIIIAGKAVAGYPERVRDMTRLATRLTPLLARDPHPSVYLVNRRPVNGLEFHLHRKLDIIPPNDLPSRLLTWTPTQPIPLYVVKKKDWNRLATQIQGAVRVEDIGPHWVGIQPARQPLCRKAQPQ